LAAAKSGPISTVQAGPLVELDLGAATIAGLAAFFLVVGVFNSCAVSGKRRWSWSKLLPTSLLWPRSESG